MTTIVAVLATLVMSVGVGAAPATIFLVPCPEETVGAECGHFEALENREVGTGCKIFLNIAMLPALDIDCRSDPLFILTGGSRQAATEAAPLAETAMRRIREYRDIVLVDQRGTGDSNPLDCAPVNADSAYYMLAARLFERERIVFGR
ncbi:MAG: hypothetical protein VX733_06985 [Candidatus Latescibacterota bacterium]|nr:hypothetical protein [Candidatus Latescibacterota bacterium]